MFYNEPVYGPSHMLRVLTEGNTALKDGNWIVVFNTNRTIEAVLPMENGKQINSHDQVVLLSLHVAKPMTEDEFDAVYDNFLELHQTLQDSDTHVLDSIVVTDDNKYLSLMCKDNECCPSEGKPYKQDVPSEAYTVLDKLVKLANNSDDVPTIVMSLDELS